MGCPSQQIFTDLQQHLKKYFELSVQIGSILHFLGLHIIQSDLGISIDQAEYTMDLLHHYFGHDVTHIKTQSTTMQYDNNFEMELFEALPLTPSELNACAIEFKGSYRFWTGQLMFLATNTRNDIAFPTQCLTEYNHAPTHICFESIQSPLLSCWWCPSTSHDVST